MWRIYFHMTILHVENLSTWHSVISPHDRFVLHGHHPCYPWQIWGMLFICRETFLVDLLWTIYSVQCIHYQLGTIPLGGSGNLVIRAHLILLVISTLANALQCMYVCILIWFCFDSDSDILISAIFNGAKICIQDLLCVKTLPFATVNRCDGGGRCCWNNLFLWFEFGCKSNVNCHKLSSPPDSTRNRYIFYISLLLQSCGTWPNVQFHTGVKLL